MKNKNELKKPSYAPLYAAAAYPMLAEICNSHGYALAVHGSLQRDLDLVAIPWDEKVSTRRTLLKAITTKTAIKIIGRADKRRYGRIAYTLSVGFGECAVDLSFLPMKPKALQDNK